VSGCPSRDIANLPVAQLWHAPKGLSIDPGNTTPDPSATKDQGPRTMGRHHFHDRATHSGDSPLASHFPKILGDFRVLHFASNPPNGSPSIPGTLGIGAKKNPASARFETILIRLFVSHKQSMKRHH